MIRTLLDRLVLQPVSFWVSVIATVISITSLYLSQRNSKRAQGLVTLEKRTKILYEIIDAQSKLIAVESKMNQTDSELKLLRSNSTFQQSRMDITRLENDNLVARQMASRLAKVLDKLKAKLESITEETKPSVIEKLMPEIRYLQSKLDELPIRFESGLNTATRIREIFEETGKEVQRIQEEAGREVQRIHERTQDLEEEKGKLQKEKGKLQEAIEDMSKKRTV